MKKNCDRCFKNVGDLNSVLSSTNMVFGSTVIFVTTKIRTKGIQTLTKGYMLLVMKSTVVKYAKNNLDSALKD